MSEWTLYRDLRDSPPLINATLRGDRADILTDLVGRGDAVWALDWDRDATQQTIQMANVGDRTSDRELDLVDYRWSTRTLGRQVESATVRGGAVGVDEAVTADVLNGNGLANDNLVEGSVRVVGTDGTAYERGADWRVDTDTGTLSYPVSTTITDDEGLKVSYEFKPLGSFSLQNADPRKDLEEVTVDATTDAMCESVAYWLVEVLQDPIESGTLTIPALPPGFSVLDALALDGLPNDDRWTPRGIDVQPGRVTLEVASRRRVQDVVADLQTRLEQHGDRI